MHTHTATITHIPFPHTHTHTLDQVLSLDFLADRSNGKSKGCVLVEFGTPEAAVRCRQALQGWVREEGAGKGEGRGYGRCGRCGMGWGWGRDGMGVGWGWEVWEALLRANSSMQKARLVMASVGAAKAVAELVGGA